MSTPEITDHLNNFNNLSVDQKVVESIAVTDSALEKAAAAEKQAAEKQAAVAALIPEAVETMVRFERITDTPEKREKLASVLSDPVQCLLRKASSQSIP